MSDLDRYVKSNVTASDMQPFKAVNKTSRSFVINEKTINPGDELDVSAKDAVFLKGEGFQVKDDIDMENEKNEEVKEEVKDQPEAQSEEKVEEPKEEASEEEKPESQEDGLPPEQPEHP